MPSSLRRKKNYRLGQLTERVDIQRYARSVSEGEVTLTWPPDGGTLVAAGVACRVLWDTPREAQRGGRLEATQRGVVVMGYRSDVTAKDRLALRVPGGTDEILQITGRPTDLGGRHRFLEVPVLRTDTDAVPA